MTADARTTLVGTAKDSGYPGSHGQPEGGSWMLIESGVLSQKGTDVQGASAGNLKLISSVSPLDVELHLPAAPA